MAMEKNLRLFLLSALALSLLLLLSSHIAERGANAQKGDTGLSQVKWEYCAAQVTEVHGSGNSKTVGVASVCYFKTSGAQCEKFKNTVDGLLENSAAAARADSLAKLISKLGDEGWEMAGEGPWVGKKSEDRPLYFRRPKLE